MFITELNLSTEHYKKVRNKNLLYNDSVNVTLSHVNIFNS